MSRAPYVTPGEQRQFVKLYCDGLNFSEIGRKTGRTADTVRKRLIAAGHYTPMKRGLTDAEARKAVALYQRGYKVDAIIDRFGIVSPHTLYRILRRHDIPLRQPR